MPPALILATRSTMWPYPRTGAAVNTPHCQLNTAALQGLAPGEDMLVDTVHQGSIEIEEKGGWGRADFHFLAPVALRWVARSNEFMRVFPPGPFCELYRENRNIFSRRPNLRPRGSLSDAAHESTTLGVVGMRPLAIARGVA
jgi:hypothetical protein